MIHHLALLGAAIILGGLLGRAMARYRHNPRKPWFTVHEPVGFEEWNGRVWTAYRQGPGLLGSRAGFVIAMLVWVLLNVIMMETI